MKSGSCLSSLGLQLRGQFAERCLKFSGISRSTLRHIFAAAAASAKLAESFFHE